MIMCSLILLLYRTITAIIGRGKRNKMNRWHAPRRSRRELYAKSAPFSHDKSIFSHVMSTLKIFLLTLCNTNLFNILSRC